MPRVAKELNALAVKRLTEPGTHAVGGVSGLILQVLPSGGRSWIIRTTIGGRRREVGLGAFPEVPLADARIKARAMKEKIISGVDPILERRQARATLAAAEQRGLTFSKAVDAYIKIKVDQFQSKKHRDNWTSTLKTYADPILGSMMVEDIQVRDVLRTLEPIWTKKNETASRLRGRIESVLSWATVAGHRVGDNPARWAGNLKELLPAVPASVVHQPAVQLVDAARWMVDLRRREGIGSRALEFMALTAARSGEVRGATWDEIDLKTSLWIIPAARMKMKSEHRVPLTAEAVAIIKALPRLSETLVFPAPRSGMLSDMTLSATMRRMHEDQFKKDAVGFIDRVSKRPAVPHGLRSTFRDWAAEHTDYDGALAEVALAHKVGNAVEAAYRRGDMMEKRKAMMSDWAAFFLLLPE